MKNKDTIEIKYSELNKDQAINTYGGIIPLILMCAGANALVYASIAVPFYMGWKAYEN